MKFSMFAQLCKHTKMCLASSTWNSYCCLINFCILKTVLHFRKDDKNEIPATSPIYQKILSRCVTVFAVLTVVYFTSKNGKEISFAKQNEILRVRSQNVDCSESFKKDLLSFPRCMPEKCGRFVSDGLVTTGEADSLLNIAQKGIALGGSDGGASILDLHSGALSRGRSFVNVYSLENAKDVFNKADLTTYKVNLLKFVI